MTMSTEDKSKVAALHWFWWRLHMCEKFSSGTINPKQTMKTLLYMYYSNGNHYSTIFFKYFVICNISPLFRNYKIEKMNAFQLICKCSYYFLLRVSVCTFISIGNTCKFFFSLQSLFLLSVGKNNRLQLTLVKQCNVKQVDDVRTSFTVVWLQEIC